MKIKCDTKKGGCGEEFELTADLIADFKEARDNGRDLGCPNGICNRRLSVAEVKAVMGAIEARLVVDPNQVTGPKNLRSIGALGVLRQNDLVELAAGSVRVAELMCDGRWYTAEEIREAAGENGEPATEGLRRMRELRDIPGIVIERERIPGGRHFRYRLVKS